MKILFVYPEFPDTFWSFKHALKFIRKQASSPPLGLLTVASMLPTGWEKRLVDLNAESLQQKDLEWADMVFISAMVIQRDSARQVIARCKQAGVKVVAGGPLFTEEHEQFPDVDHLVLNEAELTSPPFLADLALGRAQRLYTTAEYPDIRLTPAPVWKLANLKHYDAMSIQFSRGCPYHCEFCNVTTLFGHRPRTKTAAQITAELDSLYALGWRQGKVGMPFSTEVSINLADDPELLRLMAKAGFTTVFIGIETPNEDSLAECSKFQNKNRDLVNSVKLIQHAGLQVQGGFIVGFDSDTPAIFQQQMDFIQKSGIVTAMVGLLQAPYGTQLYERMKREGRLTDEMSGDNVDGRTNIIPRMGLDTLREGYKKLLDQLYSPRYYYARVRTFLQEYKPLPINVHLEPQYVLAFFRSAYQLGIKGVERAQYWKLVLWSLIRKPSLFPLAITLTIYGYHFRQVVELHVQ